MLDKCSISSKPTLIERIICSDRYVLSGYTLISAYLVSIRCQMYISCKDTVLGRTAMNVQRGKLVSGGRLQLPVEMRRALSLGDGDTVLLEMIDGEIHVRPLRDAVSRIQARLRDYIPVGVSLSDELIADRRAEATSE